MSLRWDEGALVVGRAVYERKDLGRRVDFGLKIHVISGFSFVFRAIL